MKPWPELSTVLDRALIHEALDAAEVTYARYRNTPKHYGGTLLAHIVGRVGELSAEQWFRTKALAVEAHWRNPKLDHLADLGVAGCRVEVKTWAARFWKQYGRCVAVNQLDRLAARTGVVLWETIDPTWEAMDTWRAASTVTATFEGYSTVDDIRAAPVRMTGPAGRQVENHQLDTVRELGRLLDALHGANK